MEIATSKELVAFIVFFLIFAYSVIGRAWNGIYVALPGMFLSAVAMAYRLLGGA